MHAQGRIPAQERPEKTLSFHVYANHKEVKAKKEL